jgi:hypothetical protein
MALQIRAAVLVLRVVVLLRRRGTTAALRRLAVPGGPDGGRIDPERAVVAVQRAGRVVRARCLAQSVALASLLERSGRDTAVVLGCRRYEDRRWGSHAWVLCDGAVLEPVAGGDHAELARYTAAQQWVPVGATTEA